MVGITCYYMYDSSPDFDEEQSGKYFIGGGCSGAVPKFYTSLAFLKSAINNGVISKFDPATVNRYFWHENVTPENTFVAKKSKEFYYCRFSSFWRVAIVVFDGGNVTVGGEEIPLYDLINDMMRKK